MFFLVILIFSYKTLLHHFRHYLFPNLNPLDDVDLVALQAKSR